MDTILLKATARSQRYFIKCLFSREIAEWLGYGNIGLQEIFVYLLKLNTSFEDSAL